MSADRVASKTVRTFYAPFKIQQETSESLRNPRDVMLLALFARCSPITVGDLETGGCGHSRSSKMPLFDSLGMLSYSSFIATMAVSRTVSEIHRLGQNSPINFLTLLVFSSPVRGEAVGVELWPSVTKN